MAVFLVTVDVTMAMCLSKLLDTVIFATISIIAFDASTMRRRCSRLCPLLLEISIAFRLCVVYCIVKRGHEVRISAGFY